MSVSLNQVYQKASKRNTLDKWRRGYGDTLKASSHPQGGQRSSSAAELRPWTF